MSPADLHARTADALRITGMPGWPCADGAEQLESLAYFGSGEVEEAPTWAFVMLDADASAGAPASRAVALSDVNRPRIADAPSGDIVEAAMGDYEPIPTELARRLVFDHLRGWLAARGWQVQAVMTRTGRHWRLADCLSLANGGGDRLDADYPHGDDELEVLAASVQAVHSGGKSGGPLGAESGR